MLTIYASICWASTRILEKVRYKEPLFILLKLTPRAIRKRAKEEDVDVMDDTEREINMVEKELKATQ